MAAQSSDSDAIVRRLFSVTDFFQLPDGDVEYSVKYEAGSKEKFVQLRRELLGLGLRPTLAGTKEEATLIVRKEPQRAPPTRTPIVFALLTFVSIVVFCLFQVISVYQPLDPGVSTGYVFFAMGASIVALLVGYEGARMLVSRRALSGEVRQYLIPGVPFLPPYIPSLGIVSLQRGEAVNRDAYFDSMIAGPLAMLAIGLALYILGSVTAFQSTVTLSAAHIENSTVPINSSLVQLGIGTALSPLLTSPAPGYVSLSPFGDAATVGLILVVVGLLPMAAYSGGHLASLAWGERAARAATYVCVIMLLALDIPNYFYFSLAIVVLVLAPRAHQQRFLDEVSGLSSRRRYVYFLALVAAAACIPIPHSFATIPL